MKVDVRDYAHNKLPVDIRSSDDEDAKNILQKAGVRFLGPSDDELFYEVSLPPGWKILYLEHSRGRKLVDDKGRERARIFYKAEYYDRSAHLTLVPRYRVERDHARRSKENVAVSYVSDGGMEILYSTEPIPFCGEYYQDWESIFRADELATKWLSQQYPRFNDNSAYWD